MNRYYYYHIFYVGMMNVMMFVPHILIKERFDGAVTGIAIALVAGTVLSTVTTACFQRFPLMGLPEILYRYLPTPVAVPLIATAGITFLTGGILVVFSLAQTMGAFFNPDMNEYLFLLLMVFACVFAGTRSTRTVLFTGEILVLMCVPLIALILFKAVTDRELNWDAIRVVAGHFGKRPSFRSVAATTFLFSGYMSLILFNRLYPPGFKIKHRWLLPLIAANFAFFSFFVPIGFHGTVAVENYVYLWSVTADSMMMKFGFVQRVLFTFLILYSILSLLFVMNTFHTAMEFFKSCSPAHKPQPEQMPVPKINWILCACFGGLACLYALWANDERNQWANQIWLDVRFVLEICTMGTLLGILLFTRRGARASPPRDAAPAPGD